MQIVKKKENPYGNKASLHNPKDKAECHEGDPVFHKSGSIHCILVYSPTKMIQ
jgi:hypothetical protein